VLGGDISIRPTTFEDSVHGGVIKRGRQWLLWGEERTSQIGAVSSAFDPNCDIDRHVMLQ